MQDSLAPVVARTDANRATFERFCRALTAEELQREVPRSTWLVRDFIAHLATIDIWVNEWFEHLADGRAWRPQGEAGAPFSIDTWNEGHVQHRRQRTVDELLAEAAAHREKLWSTVDRFRPEVLAQTFRFHENEITFQRYLELWSTHDPAHSADMLRALPERAAEREWRDWTSPEALRV
jgi:hypothetical protein